METPFKLPNNYTTISHREAVDSHAGGKSYFRGTFEFHKSGSATRWVAFESPRFEAGDTEARRQALQVFWANAGKELSLQFYQNDTIRDDGM